MQKPNEYDNVEAKVGGGDFPQPTAGGYVVKIVSAEEKLSKNGKNMLVIGVDIAEGEFAGHYAELSEKFNNDAHPKMYQLTEGDHVSYFKGLVTAIEHSNNGFKFDFDEKKLIGKRLGVNLREEEYKNKDGQIKTILKIAYACSVEDARNGLKVLPVKPYVDKGSAPVATVPTTAPQDSDLPF